MILLLRQNTNTITMLYTTNKSIPLNYKREIYCLGYTLKVLTLFPTPAGTRTIWCRTGCGSVDVDNGCLAPPCVTQIGTSLSRLLALPYCTGTIHFKLANENQCIVFAVVHTFSLAAFAFIICLWCVNVGYTPLAVPSVDNDLKYCSTRWWLRYAELFDPIAFSTSWLFAAADNLKEKHKYSRYI